MKLRLISLAALATIAGQAQALTLADIATKKAAGQLIEVYVSGASALSATVSGLFTQNCVAGTADTYISDKTDAAFTGDASDGASVKAYTCQLVSSNNDFGAAYNGKFVVFQKSDQGGSGNGVFPVAYGTTLPFLNLTAANCNASKVCKSNGFSTKPDGGASDVSPTGFNASLNRPKAPVDFSSKSIYPDVTNAKFARVDGVVQVVFGLAVSQPLYDALQADQGLASTVRPSVPKAVAASMLANSFDVATISWQAMLPNSPAVNVQQVNICRRVNGSGTQTSANRYFLEYPVNAVGPVPADNANNSDNAGVNSLTEIGTAGVLTVYEGSSTTNVKDCLAKANDVTAFAIGHVSLENAETAKWKFVKLDNVEPSRANAKAGVYDYAFESTVQVSKQASAAGAAFLNQFIPAAKKPANLLGLSVAAQAGSMALPTAADCAAAPFGGYAAGSAAEAFCSRVSRPNAADVLQIVR